MAKDFFAEKGIQYTGYDVSTDAQRREEMIQLTGQLGVPVIQIDDELMVGFDRAKVAAKLGLEA